MLIFHIMITIAILTKNSERTLKKTLESTKRFSEVILLDTGSKDATLEIAKNYKNVKIFFSDFDGFGNLRNKAASYASNDWILALDSDEVISEELFLELEKLKLETTICYEIPFINYYNNKQIKCCGWYPESHVRLYNKKNTSFDDSYVHESVIFKKNKIKKLKSYIYHTSYLCTDDFLHKMQLYTSLFARQNKGKKKSSFAKAISHSIMAFIKSYILKKGFLGGKEGLVISIYQANTSFYKYLKLYEVNQEEKKL